MPSATRRAPQWRLISRDAIDSVEIDGEWFVYNDHTGLTHILNDAAQHILTQLQHSPASVAQLAQQLSEDSDTPSTEAFRERVEYYLKELALLGLAEQGPAA